ncbi:MAG TPA: flavin reductase family protein [Williamwhitmania sp.]|nr:flavin reductase family protein [Williamwhitmania sp.]
MQNFKQANIFELKENPFKILDKDWMLITARKGDAVNTMTASWGGFGILWNKPVAFVVIRPQRYTFKFVESAERFSLSFFQEEYRDALKLCGSKSGRDINKIKLANLHQLDLPSGVPAFSEARLIMDCRKLYFNDLVSSNFIEQSIPKSVYQSNDFHRLYIAEIETCWVQ